ncbi:MAG: ribbon-helix-helix protein, CopG family [Actinobacteria bacterium]|nr:ribbon-helix-helix protein, CopG family [Actinomycetota bacterium]
MKKTSLYLQPELDRALSRAASAAGMTKAELIRRTLLQAVAEPQRPRIAAIGVGEGPGDVASAVDEHLAETLFGQR